MTMPIGLDSPPSQKTSSIAGAAKFTPLNSEGPFNRGSVQYHEGPQNPEGDYRIEDRCAQRVKSGRNEEIKTKK